jgi:hypothetical protein
MKKVSLLLVSTILMMFGLGVSSYAATSINATVEPRWSNTGSIDYYLDFDDSEIGYAELLVTGNVGVDQIVGEIEVYRQIGSTWLHVSGDTKTVNTRSLAMSVYVPGISGENYKTVFTATVYKNGIPEVITRTSYTTCP